MGCPALGAAPRQTTRHAAVAHHLLQNLAENAATVAAKGVCSLGTALLLVLLAAHHLLKQPAHQNWGQRGQHLLQDGLGKAAGSLRLLGDSPADLLVAEQMAEDGIAVRHAVGRKGFHRVLHVSRVISRSQRLHQFGKALRRVDITAEPLGKGRHQRLDGLLRLFLLDAELAGHLFGKGGLPLRLLHLIEHVEKRIHGAPPLLCRFKVALTILD